MAHQSPSRQHLTIVAALAAVVAACAILAGTRPPGPGLFGDAAGYLSAAESVVHTGHMRVIGAPYSSADSTMPIAQWPPGYPLALGIPMWMGLQPANAARAVAAIAGSLTVALTVILVGVASRPLWGGVAALAVLATPAVLRTDLNVLSEPLYILGLALLLTAMVARPRQPVLPGAVAAAMVLVRYLGVATIPSVGIWAAAQPGPPRTRAVRATIAMLPGAAAYIAWMALLRSEGTTSRTIALDHDLGGDVRRLLGSTVVWLVPWDSGARWAHVVAKAAIVCFAIAAFVLSRRAGQRAMPRGATPEETKPLSLWGAGRLIQAAALVLVCHLAFLLVARLLVGGVEFAPRTLAPVHFLLSVLAVAALSQVPSGVRGAQLAGAAAGGLWGAISIATSAHVFREATTIGLDHAAAAERASPTAAWLGAHATGAPIYTNEPAKIYFRLHRAAHILPWIATADTLVRLDATLAIRPGYVVWFTGGVAEGLVPDELLPRALTAEKLTSHVRLIPVAQFPDGRIWVPVAAPALLAEHPAAP